MVFRSALRRSLPSAPVASILGQLCPRVGSSHLPFSSVPSDSNHLLRALDSEITCVEDSIDHYWMGEVPDRFPFDLKDEPKASVVVLSRNYDSEKVEIEASMSNLVTGEEGDDEGINIQDPSQSSVPLVVKFSKGNNLRMEFRCTAFPEEISIDGMSIKQNDIFDQLIVYEGREFSELAEDLQKCFRRYLENRGILPTNMNFLHEYMMNKDGREYLLWLRNLKAFIEK